VLGEYECACVDLFCVGVWVCVDLCSVCARSYARVCVCLEEYGCACAEVCVCVCV